MTRLAGRPCVTAQSNPVVRMPALPIVTVIQLLPRMVDTVADNRPAIVLPAAGMLISSPFGAVLMRPQFAGDWMDGCALQVRWPWLQISGLAPVFPTNGLSFGTLPSGLMRMTLPKCEVEGLGAIFAT